jgi:hypothetical protein
MFKLKQGKSMKVKSKIVLSLLIISSLVLIPSCENKDKSQNNGKITISLTDAAADSISAVLLDIQSVDVHYTKNETDSVSADTVGGWVTLNANAGVYNLTELQNGIEKVIATGELPAGHVTQIRLILGSNNSVIIPQDTLSLVVPGALKTGIKINYDNDIVPDKQLNILLDFNLQESIIVSGLGVAKLNPVVKVKSSTYD